MHILLFSPNKLLGLPISKMLSQHGVLTTFVTDVQKAQFMAMTRSYLALVLVEAIGEEASLPIFLANLRAEGCNPYVIWLSQNQSSSRATRMLAEGSAVYHVLPHSYSQLLAEIVACKQKAHLHHMPLRYAAGHFEVTPLTRSIYYKTTLLSFTPREYAILELLIRKSGHVVSKAQLWDEVWGDEEYPTNNTIEVHIRRIRLKLPEQCITTVPGIGYRLVPSN